MNVLKIAAVCGAGVVSSEMLKIHTKKILSEEDIEAEVVSKAIVELEEESHNIIITTSKFVKAVEKDESKIVEIEDVIDREVVRKKLLKVLEEKGYYN